MDKAGIRKEIRNSIQSFNAQGYSYNGEIMWQHDGGSITVRIEKREKKGYLRVTIHIGYGIPVEQAANIKIMVENRTNRFTGDGFSRFPLELDLPAKVSLQLAE